MTVSLSPVAVQQFFDSNGKPLSGGKLFTYAAGTSGTKQNTFTDSTGNTPNTNPIILNSRGEANLWLSLGLFYKFVLSPPTDTDPPTNPIWTVDNISTGGGSPSAFYTSQYGNDYGRAVTAANAANPPGLVIVDSACVLTSTVSTVPKGVQFIGGTITLGNFSLSQPSAITADPYAIIYIQSGNGIVAFTGPAEVSPCWWGADPTGNNASSATLLTRQSFQNATVATDTFGGTIQVPDGYYIFNVAQSVYTRNISWKGNALRVRLDFDPTTIPPLASTQTRGIVATGNPLTKVYAPVNGLTRLPNQQYVGTILPGDMISNMSWEGIDIISFNTTPLSAGQSLTGLNMNYCMPGCSVKNSRFIGMPSDGVDVRYGTCHVENVTSWLNGLQTPIGQTGNNISAGGFWNVTYPECTTSGTKVINCDTRYARDENIQCGLGAGVLISGNTCIGGQDKGIEGDIGHQTTIAQWRPSQAYVLPATSAQFSISYNGGVIYQCTTAGTSASSGGPTGTGTGITDGSVVWESVGVMPADGRIPNQIIIDDNFVDGSWPATTLVNGQTVTIPDVTGFPRSKYGITYSAGNEGTIVVTSSNIIQHVGSTAAGNHGTGLLINQNNGGDITIGSPTLDDVVPDTSAQDHQIFVSPSTQGPGVGNSAGSVTIGSPVFKRPGVNGSSISQAGSPRIISIDKPKSDGGNSNLVTLNVSGVVQSIDVGGTTQGQINSAVDIVYNGSVSVGPTTIGVEGFNLNSANQSDKCYLRLEWTSGTPTGGIIMLKGARSSYAGNATTYPIIAIGSMPNNTFAGLKAYGNSLNEGTNPLIFGFGPRLVEQTAIFTVIDEFGNGIQGQNNQYVPSGTPPTGGNQGDRATVYNPVEAGSAASKYIIDGYDNVGSSTWDQRRTLTGN